MNNDPIYIMLIEEYNDVDAQYLRGLLLYYKGKYFNKEQELQQSKEIMQQIVKSDNHEGAKKILQEIEKFENDDNYMYIIDGKYYNKNHELIPINEVEKRLGYTENH